MTVAKDEAKHAEEVGGQTFLTLLLYLVQEEWHNYGINSIYEGHLFFYFDLFPCFLCYIILCVV